MKIHEAIKKTDEMLRDMVGDLKTADDPYVKEEIKKDMRAIRKLQDCAWKLLLGDEYSMIGGRKIV